MILKFWNIYPCMFNVFSCKLCDGNGNKFIYWKCHYKSEYACSSTFGGLELLGFCKMFCNIKKSNLIEVSPSKVLYKVLKMVDKT